MIGEIICPSNRPMNLERRTSEAPRCFPFPLWCTSIYYSYKNILAYVLVESEF